MIPLFFVLAAAWGAPTTAPHPDFFGPAERVSVSLSDFSLVPSALRLKAGQPVVLRFTNVSSHGHDFTAPAFFAAALIRPDDARSIQDGGVHLRGGESVLIALVPSPGRFPAACTHPFHKMLGMSGSILVER